MQCLLLLMSIEFGTYKREFGDSTFFTSSPWLALNTVPLQSIDRTLFYIPHIKRTFKKT